MSTFPPYYDMTTNNETSPEPLSPIGSALEKHIEAQTTSRLSAEANESSIIKGSDSLLGTRDEATQRSDKIQSDQSEAQAAIPSVEDLMQRHGSEFPVEKLRLPKGVNFKELEGKYYIGRTAVLFFLDGKAYQIAWGEGTSESIRGSMDIDTSDYAIPDAEKQLHDLTAALRVVMATRIHGGLAAQALCANRKQLP